MIVHRPSILLAFGDDHDTAVLALAESSADELPQLVHIRLVFRYDGCLRSGGDCTVLCEEARIASHYLHEEDPVVGGGGVTDLVHAFHYGVECGVVTDGRVGAVQVVVDCPGKPDARYIMLLGEYLRPCKRTVSSDDDKCIDIVGLHVVVCLLSPLDGHEVIRAGGLEDRASPLYGVADAFRCEILYLVVDQTLISSVYSFYLPSVEDGRPCHGPDGRIHSRSIASGCENSDGRNLCHITKCCNYTPFPCVPDSGRKRNDSTKIMKNHVIIFARSDNFCARVRNSLLVFIYPCTVRAFLLPLPPYAGSQRRSVGQIVTLSPEKPWTDRGCRDSGKTEKSPQ